MKQGSKYLELPDSLSVGVSETLATGLFYKLRGAIFMALLYDHVRQERKDMQNDGNFRGSRG
jgi:hypothetical protein